MLNPRVCLRSQPFGSEAPELAQAFLAGALCVPSPQQDIWCIGQAMMWLLHADQPLAQCDILNSIEYQQDKAVNRRSRKHLRYLAALQSTCYADQVCFPASSFQMHTCVLYIICQSLQPTKRALAMTQLRQHDLPSLDLCLCHIQLVFICLSTDSGLIAACGQPCLQSWVLGFERHVALLMCLITKVLLKDESLHCRLYSLNQRLAALQPEEEQPFRLLLQQIRACLHASPAQRASADGVARTLHAEARRLQWL